MGILISCPDESAPIPREVVLTLTCDVPSNPPFPPARATFRDRAGGYVAQRAAATAVGWLETAGRAGRVFVCPDCVLAGRRP